MSNTPHQITIQKYIYFPPRRVYRLSPYPLSSSKEMAPASLRKNALQLFDLLLVELPRKVNSKLNVQVSKLAWEIMHRHALSRELTHLPVVHHRAKSVDLNLVPIKMFEGPLESGQRLLQGDGDLVVQVVSAALKEAVLRCFSTMMTPPGMKPGRCSEFVHP